MPTTTLKRLPGIALVLALDGTPIGCWDNLKLDSSAKFATPSSADSPIVQKVITEKDAKGSIDTWLGSQQAPILNVSDEFLVLSIKEGANDVSSILAAVNDPAGDYADSKARVVSVSESYMKDPAKGTINFEFGFID